MKTAIISAYNNLEDMTIKFLDNLDIEGGKLYLTNAASKPIEHAKIHKRIDLDVNKSFSNSMNHALKCALEDDSYDYYCIIGNDVFPNKGWLSKLIEYQQKTNAGIVCPMPTRPDQSIMKAAHCTQDVGDYWVCNIMFPAICWLIPKQIIKEVGFFDEQFEIGCYEDNDYCKRVRKLGQQIIVVKEVVVDHLLSQTLNQYNNMGSIMAVNGERFAKKWN